MDKSLIKELIKEVMPNAELPSSYGYTYKKDKKELTLFVKNEGLKANMQNDEAAFESWTIALKYYLKDIETITIDWDGDITKDCEDDISNDDDGILHFNRFVYRLAKFVQTYSWARSAKTIPTIPTMLYCNVGTNEAASADKHSLGSEGWLECKYVEEHSMDYDVINHQFPVGLFQEKVSRTTHYTTGGKSAIDIWAIKDDCLSIFELKKPENKHLGIISELMFYTNIVDDILSHRIMYEEESKNVKLAEEGDIRGFKKFYEVYEKGSINKIESIFLADNLHPLLSDELIDFINDSPRWKYKNISFKHKRL